MYVVLVSLILYSNLLDQVVPENESKSPDVLSNTNENPRKITTDVLVVESLEPFVIYYSFNCYDVALGLSKASFIFTLMVNQLGDKILTTNLKVRLTTGGGMIPSQSHNEIACAELPNCKGCFEHREQMS